MIHEKVPIRFIGNFMKSYLYFIVTLWTSSAFATNVEKGSYVGLRLASDINVPFFKVLEVKSGGTPEEDKIIVLTSSGLYETWKDSARLPTFDFGRNPIVVNGIADPKIKAQILGVYHQGKIAYKVSTGKDILEKSIFEFEKEFDVSKQFFRKFYLDDFGRFPGVTLTEKGEFVMLKNINPDGSFQAVVVEELDDGRVLNLSPDSLNNPAVVEWAKKFKGKYVELKNPDGSPRFYGQIERIKKVDNVWMMSIFDHLNKNKQDIELDSKIGKKFGMILSADNPYLVQQAQVCPELFQALKR